MGDLLEYFEAQSMNLDKMSASVNSPIIPTNFTSCIKFNGIPILPPVMTQTRREEMMTYRRQAMKLENRRKSKQREKLVARVQSIVAEVEEKQTSRLSDSVDSSPVSSGTDVSSKWSPESANAGADVSPSGKFKNTSQNPDKTAERFKSVSSKGIEKEKPVQKTDQKKERVITEQRTKIPAPVQNVKKTPQKSKSKSSSKSKGNALNNLKKSSSMSSLPNPAKIPGTPSYPLPKPPSTKMTELQARRSNLLLAGRISFSNPDLRDFDDDNSLSCKSESGISRNTRKRKSKSAWQQSNHQSASDPDLSRNEISESQGFVLSPDDPVLQSTLIQRIPKRQLSTGSNPELSSTKYSPEVDTEKLKEAYLAAKKKVQKSDTKTAKEEKKQLSTGKETQEKVQHTQNESKGDEPQSLNDLPSLDECNSLPHEFSGIPLTSVKQQQIGQVLAKLSKCLNLQDTGGTLNSTSSSSSTENNAKQSVDPKNQNPNHKNTDEEKKKRYLPSPTILDNSGNSGRSEVNVSGFNQSAVNSSVISSVGSVGTNQSKRMSPKGLKNTVHFSSFVTEISTSASQSVEDKISVRKMDVTPTNSVEFVGNAGSTNSSEVNIQYGKSVPKYVSSQGSAPQVRISTTQSYSSLFPGQSGSMLSKVALSPEESPGSVPKTFFKDQDVPFHVYTAEIEHNTSDKENENIYQNKYFGVTGDKLHVLDKEFNKNSDQTYGNAFLLTGKRSCDSDDRSQGSTLKESQENIIIGVQKPYLSTEIYSELNKTDFEKVMKVSAAVTGSSGHVMGDVSQSNRLSQGMSAAVDKIIPSPNPLNVPKQMSGHVRHGSYTLDKPSEALLNAHSNPLNVQHPDSNVTKMNIRPERDEPVSISQNDINIPMSESSEQSAKAEHIQRYLSQVQSHSVDAENIQHQRANGNANVGQYDIAEAVQSFTETLQSMDTLSEDEMLKIQADHFNKIRQHLVEQQKQQLEELFVQQRREQLNLQEEIELHHKHLREQQELFSSFSDANNLSQYSMENLQNISVNSYNDPTKKYANPVHNKVNPNIPVNNFVGSQPQFTQQNSGNRYVPNKSAVSMYKQANSASDNILTTSGSSYGPATGNSGNEFFQNDSILSNIPGNINQPVYSQHLPVGPATQQKQFAYISSPSLYFNPKDRDNESDISTFSKVTPKQSLKFNQSTPSPKSYQPVQPAVKSYQPHQQSPKLYKPVQHSPVKEVHHAWTSSTMAFPEDAFDPRLQLCFDRVSAYAKGYLTRRLIVTDKVQEIVKTINDTKHFARSFQSETPIKKGQVNNQDRNLLDRIIAQLQAALLDVHEIFFDIPVWERMQIIAHDRQLREERRLRESGATTRSSVSSSQPRISSATLKAIERKRKAQEAEMAVFGDIRPKTAPPVNQRCQRESMDVSGPLRRHFQFLLSRALQPVHMSHSHNTTHSGNTTARIKTRPKTAPSQLVQQQNLSQPSSNPSNQQTTAAAKTRKTSSTAKSTASGSTVAPKKGKSGKAWR